jgi:chromosome segregation ATPase
MTAWPACSSHLATGRTKRGMSRRMSEPKINLKRLIQFAELAGRDTTPDGEALNALRMLRRELNAAGMTLEEVIKAGNAPATLRIRAEFAEMEVRRLTGDLQVTEGANARLRRRVEELEKRFYRSERTNRKLSCRIEELEARPANGSPAHATAALKAKADAKAREIGAVIATLDTTSPSAIAEILNERKIPAPRGGQWTARQVRRAITRLLAN